MPFRYLFCLVLINFSFVVVFFFMFWWFTKTQKQSFKENEALLDERISKIVLSTVVKIREDLGILQPVPVGSANNDSEEAAAESKPVRIEGANLSTFEHHFYIDNIPYFIGDVIAPYGMAFQIGRDCVIFDDLNGGLVVLGKQLKKEELKDQQEDKTSKNVG